MHRLGRWFRISAMRVATPALVGILTLASAACTSAATKRSVQLYERGDYRGAASAADGGIASDREDEGAWQMRVRAALALGDAAGLAGTYQRYKEARGGDDRALARELAEVTLRQALTSPSVALRMAAIRAAEESELAGLADAVAERMTDPDDRVVATAAAAVLRGYADAGDALDDMMHSEDAEARRIALDGLGRKMAKHAVAELSAAVGDGEAGVRRTALHHLAALRDGDLASLFLQHVADPDDGVRAEVTAAFAELAKGKKAMDQAATALAAAARDRALAVRVSAVRLAAALGDGAALTALLGDADVTVALAAAAALHREAASLTALFDRVLGADGASKIAALNQATALLGAAAAQQRARAAAQDPDVAVRLAAARVLAHGGAKPEALALLIPAIAGEPSTRTIEAAVDLIHLGDPRGDEALARASQAPSAELRARAAAAHRLARKISPALFASLADASGTVRVEAAAALAALAGRE